MEMQTELLCAMKKERLLMEIKLLLCLLEDGNQKNFKRRSSWNFNVKLWFRKIFKNEKIKFLDQK